MSYIGTPPSNAFTALLKQDFSTSATTGYTLDHAVNNANDIALFINFVRQEPTAAYSASGTTLTLTSATASSDDMYCVYLGQALQTVNPPNASVGLSQLTASGTKDATTFLRGDNTFAVAGGTNTPLVYAYKNNTQSVANNTATEIIYNQELYDTGSAFDTSTGRFTPQEAGYYQVMAWFRLATGTDLENVEVVIRKNGSAISANPFSSVHNDSYNTAYISSIVNLNGSSDYVSAFAFQYSGGSLNIHSNGNGFNAFKLIG